MLRLVFGQPWRQTEVLLRSIAILLGVSLTIPDHTTFSRRSTGLSLAAARQQTAEPIHVVIDSTGLKVYGVGEWQAEKHGEHRRRTWRKLHLAVNLDSHEILASELTTNEVGDLSMVLPLLNQIQRPLLSLMADGAYDAKSVYRTLAVRQPDSPPAIIIPPRSTAVLHPTANTAPNLRGRHIRTIQEKGRRGWERAVGYGMRARRFEAQQVEVNIACCAINRMTQLGMPISQRVR